MSAGPFKLKIRTFIPNYHNALFQCVLFIIPSLIVTVVSIVLFALFKDNSEQLGYFTFTIWASVIISLAGTAGIQILMYQIVNSGKYEKKSAAARGIEIGLFYSLIFSTGISAILYPFLHNILHLPLDYYLCLGILIILFSFIWTITSAFGTINNYIYPAAIFTIAYLIILVSNYFISLTNIQYIIWAYAAGVFLLFVYLWVVSRTVFRKTKVLNGFFEDIMLMIKLIPKSISAILFQVSYLIATFLDKIIVWIYQSVLSGQVVNFNNTYMTGSFLGLIPLFSIATIAYFTNKVSPIVEGLYKGTLFDIRTRIEEYKSIYFRCLIFMLIISGILSIAVIEFCSFYVKNPEVLKIAFTVSVGSIFFGIIIFNSIILPIFGKTFTSFIAVMLVCIIELASIFLAKYDIWYASLGFLAGSLVGCIFSQWGVLYLFFRFEYHLFRYVTTYAA
jgi:hypothetical protein